MFAAKPFVFDAKPKGFGTKPFVYESNSDIFGTRPFVFEAKQNVFDRLKSETVAGLSMAGGETVAGMGKNQCPVIGHSSKMGQWRCAPKLTGINAKAQSREES